MNATTATTTTTADRPFQPDYAVPPGAIILEFIEELHITQTELARRMARPLKTINQIIHGKAALTAETALQLSAVLGMTAEFWATLESNYRLDLARRKLRNLADAAAVTHHANAAALPATA